MKCRGRRKRCCWERCKKMQHFLFLRVPCLPAISNQSILLDVYWISPPPSSNTHLSAIGFLSDLVPNLMNLHNWAPSFATLSHLRVPPSWCELRFLYWVSFNLFNAILLQILWARSSSVACLFLQPPAGLDCFRLQYTFCHEIVGLANCVAHGSLLDLQVAPLHLPWALFLKPQAITPIK